VPYTPATAWTLTTSAMTDITVIFATGDQVVKSNYDFSSNTADGIQISRSTNGSSTRSFNNGGTLRVSSSDFAVAVDRNIGTGAYVKNIDISRTSSFGSRMTKTLTPLAGVSGPPDTGVLQVTRTDSANATLITTYTALSGGNVRVNVDSDDDGVIDTTTDTTWAALWQLN